MSEVKLIQFVFNALIVIFGRILDITSTRYVTRELKLETNKLARKIGWRGMILLQIPIVFLGSLDFYFAIFIFFWSILLFGNNIQGSWYIKEVGENNYRKELSSNLKVTKPWKIIIGEISLLITFTFSGLFIIIALYVFDDIIAVFFIALALICQGILGTVRSLRYLFALKKENQE
jgi:hypothetical protein